jgi:hypothetical protein
MFLVGLSLIVGFDHLLADNDSHLTDTKHIETFDEELKGYIPVKPPNRIA